VLLYTTLLFLDLIVGFYIIRDYVLTLEYTLTNVDYICVSSLVDDHIIYDTKY
jgi:hypothetical protein